MGDWKGHVIRAIEMVLLTLMVVAWWIMDQISSASLEPELLGWELFFLPTAAAFMLVQWWIIHRDTKKKNLSSAGNAWETIKIEDSILNRWYAVWNEFGIDSEEDRAEPWHFPAQIAQIVALEDVREASDDRELRKRLGARVFLIIRETLGPLATELDYLAACEREVNELMKAADEILAEMLDFSAQATNTVHGEMLLAIT